MSKITGNLYTDTTKARSADKAENKISPKFPSNFDKIEIGRSDIQNPIIYNAQANLNIDNKGDERNSYKDLNNQKNFFDYVDLYMKINRENLAEIRKNPDFVTASSDYYNHSHALINSLLNAEFLPIKNEELVKLNQIIENEEMPIQLREAAVCQISDYNIENTTFDSFAKILNDPNLHEVLIITTLFKLDELASTGNLIPNNVLEAIDKFVPTIEIASRIYQHLILNNNQSISNQALYKLSEAINNNYFDKNTKKFISFIFVKIFKKSNLLLTDATVNNLIDFTKNDKNSIISRYNIMCVLDSNKTVISDLSRNKVKNNKF